MKRLIVLSIIMLAAMSMSALAQEGGMSDAEMNKAMMKAGAPGEHHGHLAKLTGEFTYTAKAWMKPGAEAQEWAGTRSARMIMDGRFLQEEVDGSFMGMPFTGLGIYAYDNLSEQYVVTWIDNMSTSVLQSTGSCSVNGFVTEGTHTVPGVGENAFRNVIRWVDEGTFVFEWHETIPGQDETFKMMEITYTRK